jgi:uncharacterized SAM-binding protein YcdF (DUF218 family)
MRDLRRKTAIRLAGAVAAGLVAVTIADFARRMESSPAADRLPHNAVVFTGQFERVHAGLLVLHEGRVERLLISGANPGAGIWPDRFVAQFKLDATLRDALAAGDLVLGIEAENTFQNAKETAGWYRARGLSGPLLLITSRRHMPRASLALERALAGRKVYRMSISDDGSIRVLVVEFLKFVVTAVTVLWTSRG